jgi:hypothetical protein
LIQPITPHIPDEGGRWSGLKHCTCGFQTNTMYAVIFIIVYGEIEGEGALKTPGKKQDV